MDVADTLVQYALANNVTDMIVGQSPKRNLWQRLALFGYRPITERIVSLHPSVTLRITPVEKKHPVDVPAQSPLSLKSFMPYLFSLLVTISMLLAAGKISKYTSITNTLTLFFLSILWVSVKFGLKPALLATVVSSLAYDYLYIQPKHYLGIGSLEGWWIFTSFVIITLVVSNLAIQSRDVFSISQGRLRQIRFFSGFIRQLIQYSDKNDVLSHLVRELHRFLKISVIAFWDTQEGLKPVIQYPQLKEPDLTEADASAIQWALAHQNRSGRSTENFPDARYLYLPIKIGNNSLGVVGIWALKDQLTIDDFRVAQTLIDQAALAIDRLNYMKPLRVKKDV
jgi:two-component system sensor histidine kinase KdpD